MFKKSLLAVSLLALTSSVAFAAAPTAKLKVIGTIQPPTCTINGEASETTVNIISMLALAFFQQKVI